jgi:hypothetical protein
VRLGKALGYVVLYLLPTLGANTLVRTVAMVVDNEHQVTGWLTHQSVLSALARLLWPR